MYSTPYEALIAYIVSVDAAVTSLLLPMVALFAVAAVALLGKGRRPLELLSMFLIAFVLIFSLVWFVMHVVADRPFFRVETVRYP